MALNRTLTVSAHTCGVGLAIGLALAVSAEGGKVTFHADGIRWEASVPAISTRVLRAITADPATARYRLDRALDSLGYFEAVWDSTSSAIRVLHPGVRAEVKEIILNGDTGVLSLAGIAEHTITIKRPYDAGELKERVNHLLKLLGRAGYPFARADLSVRYLKESSDDTPPGVRLIVSIAAGCRCRVDSVAVLSRHTRRNQVLHDIGLTPGTPFNQELLIEARQRLTRRPYIDSVEIPAPRLRREHHTENGECSGNEGVVIPVRIVDRHGASLEGAVSVERTSLPQTHVTGALDIGLLNVLGIGERVVCTYRGSTGTQRLAISLGKVHIGAMPLGLDCRFAVEIARQQYGCIEGAIEALYELRGPWRTGLGVHAQENTIPDSGGRTWHVYGGSLLLDLPSGPVRRGLFSKGVEIRTGVEGVFRGESRSTRWRLDAGTEVQAPIGNRLALGLRLGSWNVFTREQQLTPAEMYRIGGYRTLRGYPEDYIVARNAVSVQVDYRIYLIAETAAYIFSDGGMAWSEGIERNSPPVGLMGYGLGIRIPGRRGTVTLEWGRNIEDRRSAGRIHVRIANRLAHSER